MEEDDILYQSIIADPEKVSPDVDISRLRTQTETSPQLLAAVSEFPGLQFDPTQYSVYEDLYDLYSTGLPMIPTPATDTAQIPGAADILVDTGSQDQATGDLGLDTTFQDAGATDVPGTIGTLGSLTEPTTQIAPTVNLLDEFGTAGDVYADVPPTTVDTPALDLSGTSEELIDQGVIETPQEFANRAYGLDYEALDQEEQNIIDEDYTTKYSLPTYTPSKGLEINVPNTIANIIGKYATSVPLIGTAVGTAVDYFTDDKDSPVSERIDFDTYADPSVDAFENDPANIENIVQSTPLETAIGIDYPEIRGDDEIISGDTVTETKDPIEDFEVSGGIAPGGSDQVLDTFLGPVQESEGRDTDVQQSGTTDSDDFSGYDSGGYDPAPAPTGRDTDVQQSGTTDSSGSSGGGGGGCVIATHAVDSGAFTPETKREAVRWCIKNLHRTWWGEAVRKGYRYYGQKAIEEGEAKNHYQEFKDYVAFGTGRKRTFKTAWTFVYRTIQFFIKGITIKNAKR